MLGTAGGMYHFRDQIRAGNPSAFFVLNGDVCADFPLQELYDFHKSKDGQAEVSKYSMSIVKSQFHSSSLSIDYYNEYRSYEAAICPLWLSGN